VLARLHEAMGATLADPAVVGRLAEQGCDVETSASPAGFAAFLASERRRWAEVVQRAGLREG
jgi:tripartite-type tricarboxylate transporter receptor subunit TctC